MGSEPLGALRGEARASRVSGVRRRNILVSISCQHRVNFVIDPSKGAVVSNCPYPHAVFFNFYREVYLRQEGPMAPKSPLDEPVISGPFSLYEGSFILEFLEPHPSRDAT